MPTVSNNEIETIIQALVVKNPTKAVIQKAIELMKKMQSERDALVAENQERAGEYLKMFLELSVANTQNWQLTQQLAIVRGSPPSGTDRGTDSEPEEVPIDPNEQILPLPIKPELVFSDRHKRKSNEADKATEPAAKRKNTQRHTAKHQPGQHI